MFIGRTARCTRWNRMFTEVEQQGVQGGTEYLQR